MENALQMLPCRKRTFSSTHDEGLSFGEPQSKIAAKIKWYVLESESSLDSCTDDGTESIHSIQDKETDCVRDTSDTESSSGESLLSEDAIAVEFDVISSSDDETSLWAVADSDSSSGTDDILTAGVVAAICSRSSHSDDGNAPGDTESESQGENGVHSESDTNLSKPGKCIQCKGPINTDPLYRYCERCYQVRKTFFPPRPRGYRSRNKHLKSSALRSLSSGSKVEVSGSQESGLGSSQETNPSDMIINVKGDGEHPSNNDNQHNPSFTSNAPKDDASSDLCIVCMSSPKNGIFVHGSIGHMCCCYRCAVKVWMRTRRCPACNCKSKNVIKAFFV